MSNPAAINPSPLRATTVALALATLAAASPAAPNISRLTPPSNPLSAEALTLARFLPGQRFDLQATVQPEADTTIQRISFAVDGRLVASFINDGSAGNQFSGNTGLVKNGLNASLAANTVVATLRAYSSSAAGIHTLTATATDSAGAQTVRSGNFEVVATSARGRRVKNIIFLLGDGMGAAHRTAARIVAKGYAQGKAQGRLAMDTFPYTGLVMTASLDTIVTDSAPGMANYVNGNKANSGQEGVFPDDTADSFDNPRVEYLSEYLHRLLGKNTGIVTTADVFDATPAANAVHTSDRGKGTGIVDQYLDDRGLTGLTVLLGGGRKWFLPNADDAGSPQPANGSQRRSTNDYVLTSDIVSGWGAAAGAKDPGRDLITDFQHAGFSYVADKAGLDSAPVNSKLLGLFAYSNMNVALDKINGRRGASTVVNDYGFPNQPLLDEMAAKAIKVLEARSPKGFFLMIEGASIDKQAHLMDSDRWIEEVIEFDHAVKVAQDYAVTHPDTLVIVTADHECSGAALIGASLGTAATQAHVGTYQSAKFPKYAIAADGYPVSTDFVGKLLVGYGANADRYETWLTSAQPTQDPQQPFVGAPPLNAYPANANLRNAGLGYLVTGQVGGEQAVHTATDVPLSAFGRGASLFTGVFDNTDVFFKLGQLAIGGIR
jgi:alkaline phosphatase